MRKFFNDSIKKAYEMVCDLGYDNNVYCPIYRYKYTEYNIEEVRNLEKY